MVNVLPPILTNRTTLTLTLPPNNRCLIVPKLGFWQLGDQFQIPSQNHVYLPSSYPRHTLCTVIIIDSGRIVDKSYFGLADSDLFEF